MIAPCRLSSRCRPSVGRAFGTPVWCRSPGYTRWSYSTPSTSQYDPVTASISDLRHQDPQGRIRFIMDRASPDHIYRSIRGIDSLTAYVIPTWAIMARFLVHQTWKVSNQKRVDMPVRTNIGCTITAVPKGHWAHGVILSDDFSDISAMSDRLTEFRGDSRSRNYMLDLHSVAEPFSLGYPRLGSDEYTSLLRLAIPDVFSSPMGTEKVTIVNKLLEAHPIVALPLYRVVYKATMLDESTMFIDPCRRAPKSIVAFKVGSGTASDFSKVDQRSGTLDPHDLFGIRVANAKGTVRFVKLDSQEQAGPMSELLYGCCTGHYPDWASDDIMPADTALKDFIQREEDDLREMSAKAPVVNRLLQSPRHWQHMIAQIDAKLQGFKQGTKLTHIQTIRAVKPHTSTVPEPPTLSAESRMPSRRDVPSPVSPVQVRPAPLADTTSPHVVPSSATPVSVRPGPSDTPPRSVTSQTSKRKLPPKVPLPPPGPSRPIPPLPQSTMSVSRTKTSEALATQKTSPLPKSTSPPKSTSRTIPTRPVTEVPRKASSQDLPISDPMSYYRILVVSPTTRFIDGRHAQGVDRLLQQKRIRLARQLHPDTAQGDSELMGRINDAFDHVETLALRLVYYREGANMRRR